MKHTEELEKKVEVLRSISHVERFRIVSFLTHEGQKNVTMIQQYLNIPQSGVSQHLSKLKSSGVIASSRNAREVFYEMKNNEMKKMILNFESLDI